MRAIVTGGAGFIGSHLVDALVERGDEVVVVDNLSSGKREQVNAGAALDERDIRDGLELDGADVVFHLAAQADVQTSMQRPDDDAAINVVGTVRVLEAARAAGAQVVFTSTGGAIYGECDGPASEDAPRRAVSPYGIAKLCGEEYLGGWNRIHGLGNVVLRLANVYGPRQVAALEGGVVAIFLEQLGRGEQTTIFGDGLQTRDFVYVGDVVDALLAAAGRRGGVFNVGTGAETTILDLHRHCAEVVGDEAEPRFEDARLGDARRSVLDVSLAERALAAAALAALACAVFVPAVWAGFLSDDFLLLTNLHHAGVGWVFAHNDIGEAGAAGHFYRPFWVLWNLWLFRVFGGSAVAFHVANLVLYAVVVAEVWALASTFVDASRAWIAAAAFAVYPRHGESVAWVSGSTDLVAVTAALAALLVVRSRASLGVRVAVALLLTAIATLSKEITFTLPVLALLVLPRRDDRRELLLPAAMLLVEIGTFAARYAVIGGIGGYTQYPWTAKLMVGSFGSYVLASGIPPSIPAFRYWPVFLLPVALFALVLWRGLVLHRRGAAADVRLVGIGAAWFVVALLPLASLPVDLNNANGERNLLLASVGLALAVAGLIPARRSLLATAGTAAGICALAGLALYSSFDWVEAGRLSKRLVPAAAAMAPRGGELILLSQPEGFRTAHVFIGGDLSREFRYRGITGVTAAFCAPVELRAVRAGEIRFQSSGGAYHGESGWSAAFDLPVLHSAAGLTGECSYARLSGPKRPGLALRILVTPTPSQPNVVIAYFDGRDFKRCC